MGVYTRTMLVLGLGVTEPADAEGRSLLERHRLGLLTGTPAPDATEESLGEVLGRERDGAFGLIKAGVPSFDGETRWYVGQILLSFEWKWAPPDHDGPLPAHDLAARVREVESRLAPFGVTRPPRLHLETFTH